MVVGGGTSAVQLLTEISTVASTTWVTRHPPVFYEGPFTYEHRRAAVARVEQAVREGRPPASVVSVTGLTLSPQVKHRAGRAATYKVRRLLADLVPAP